MATRQIIYVWFPYLAAERLRRTGVIGAEQTLVLTSKYQGADYINAICWRAHHRGLQVGMRLADARALCPDLVSRDFDPAKDADDLRHLALWARRYCPLTAPDCGVGGTIQGGTIQGGTALDGIAFDGGGIWLDVAGAAHLYGGVRALLADMLRRLRRAGLRAKLAIAPTCGGAWGLARYQRKIADFNGEIDAAFDGAFDGAIDAATRKSTRRPLELSSKRLARVLAPLPLSALRLDMRTCNAMSAAGLRSIGDIIGMPRAPLARRFSNVLIERLDAALGHINESFTPIAPPRPLLASLNFAEPVSAGDDIAAVVHKLAEDIAQILEENGLATRRLRLGWQRVDGTILVHDTHLSRPGRDVAAFHRLLATAGAAIDPEFGLECAWIEAHLCSPQAPICGHFDDGINADATYASLVDRLVARLGFGAVLQMQTRDCWQPEVAQYMALPDMQDGAPKNHSRPPPPITTPPRPIRLLTHPQPLSVVALLPDHPPAQFNWQKKTYRVRRASGPERIAPQWWTAAAGSKTRDYFRLEDEQGARFWVYREGLPERNEDVSWFLHGFFA